MVKLSSGGLLGVLIHNFKRHLAANQKPVSSVVILFLNGCSHTIDVMCERAVCSSWWWCLMTITLYCPLTTSLPSELPNCFLSMCVCMHAWVHVGVWEWWPCWSCEASCEVCLPSASQQEGYTDPLEKRGEKPNWPTAGHQSWHTQWFPSWTSHPSILHWCCRGDLCKHKFLDMG